MLEGFESKQIEFDEKYFEKLQNENLAKQSKFLIHPLSLKNEETISSDGTHILPREDIRFLTQNMYCLPGLPEGKIKLHKSARCRELIRTVLPQFDILCLQEVFYTLNDRKESVVHHSQLAGFPYHAKSNLPEMYQPNVTDSGLLTLSRFPILVSEYKPFKQSVLSDAIAKKGILYTKIQIKDQILHVFNTHTNASYITTNLDHMRSSFECREKQNFVIRDFINVKLDQHQESKNDLIVLCGDLNINSKRDKFVAKIRDEIIQDTKYPASQSTREFLDQALEEYKYMMDIFSSFGSNKCVDALQDSLDYRLDDKQSTVGQRLELIDVTYGDTITDDDGVERPREVGMMNPEDFGIKQRLDYILQIDAIDVPESNHLELDVLSTVVEPYFTKIDEKSNLCQQPFSQLSDHYGISTSIKFKKQQTFIN